MRRFLLAAVVCCLFCSQCFPFLGDPYQARLNELNERRNKLAAYQTKELADVKDRRKELDLLSDKCAADEKTYIANRKAPFLKSCLEHLNELKSGINDQAAKDQCSKDMLETIPSCQEWSSKRQALLNSLQEDIRKGYGSYVVPPPLP